MTVNEVLRQFQRTYPNKAARPDGIKPSMLKYCAEQLCSMLCVIFNQSLLQCKIPPTWKTSFIVPVPKKSPVKSMNDLRPVALTSAAMKVFERVVLIHFQAFVTDFLDPWVPAGSPSRGGDVKVFVLDKLT